MHIDNRKIIDGTGDTANFEEGGDCDDDELDTVVIHFDLPM